MFGLMKVSTHEAELAHADDYYRGIIAVLDSDKASLRSKLTTSQLETAQANETIEALKARIAKLEKPVPIAKAKTGAVKAKK